MWKFGLAIVSLSLASGCGGHIEASENYSEDLEGQVTEDVEFLEEAACSTPQGANYMLAALAAATAMELKRWQTAKDFAVVKKYNYSMAGWQEVVDLTTTGRNLCAWNGCTMVQSILDFQKKESSGVKFADGSTLQSDIFAQRLVANLKAQITCNSQPDNKNASNCPVEQHTLVFSSKTPGTCDTDYWFHAYKEGTTTALAQPAQLKNQLITFGSTASNPYLAFDVQGDDVKVDPSPGTLPGDTATSGSCTQLGGVNAFHSTSNIAGLCCKYSTYQGKFAKLASPANYYSCNR